MVQDPDGGRGRGEGVEFNFAELVVVMVGRWNITRQVAVPDGT